MTRTEFEGLAFSQMEDLYCTARTLSDGDAEALTLVREAIVTAYSTARGQDVNADGGRIWLFKCLADTYTKKLQRLSESPSTEQMITHIYDTEEMSVTASRLPAAFWTQASFTAIAAFQVRRAVRELPGHLRLVLALSLHRDLTYQDIAEITDLDRETVRLRLHQSRALMQEKLHAFANIEREHRLSSVEVENGRVN